MEYKRGDIVYVDIPYATGSEMLKDRPGVIVSNDAHNFTSGVVCVVFLTGSREPDGHIHVDVQSAQSVRHGPSVALCEQIYTVDKSRLGKRIRCRTAETAERDNCHYRAEKPEGVAVELADCILRILDYMGQVGGDVDGMMRDLGSLAPAQPGAGVKKTLPDLLAGCHYLLSSAYMSQRSAEMLGRRKGRKIRAVNLRHPFRVRDFERTAREKMVGCILDILRWASANGVDMEEIIAAKHEYNKAREYRHGGKRL